MSFWFLGKRYNNAHISSAFYFLNYPETYTEKFGKLPEKFILFLSIKTSDDLKESQIPCNLVLD